MAATATAPSLVKLPAGPAPPSPEQVYWKTFKNHRQLPTPNHNPVTSIASSAASGSTQIAITAGPRVLLLDARASSVARQIARFPGGTARGAHFRPQDARVLVAGDEGGGIQVFDASTRSVLRTWKQKQGIWVTRFAPHATTSLLSAGDDTTIKEWDLAADDPTRIFTGHADYVRAAAYLPGPAAAGLIASGSYDRTVKIWDPRAPGRAALTFQHDAALEAVLPMPSGTTVLAAAGNQISVLDLVGARPLRVLHGHQKTVTTLAWANQDSRLVSGGLDGHVQVFETASWNRVAGQKYPSPILALDVTRTGAGRDDRHLVVGLQSGVVSIKTRLMGEAKTKEKARQQEMDALLAGDDADQKSKAKRSLSSAEKRRLRGRDYLGDDADIVLDAGLHPARRPKLQPWQRSLRAARYATALDQALETHDPRNVVTLLIALRHRSALTAALEHRDETTLQPILDWLRTHLVDPRFVDVCAEAGAQLLALYAGHAGQSPAVDERLRALHEQVRSEIECAHQACQTAGMLSLLMKS